MLQKYQKLYMLVVCLLFCLWLCQARSVLSEKCSQLIKSQLNIEIPYRIENLNKDYPSKNITKQNVLTLIKSNCLIKLHPYYKWAQNTTHIQVKIQFKASGETTPCQNIIYENKTVSYERIELQILCIHSQTYLVYYQISVKTFKSMNYHTLNWLQIPNKYYVLQIMKAPAPYIWKYLYSPETPPEKKPKVWWQMLKKYQKDMGTLIDKMDIGEQDRQVSAYVKQNIKTAKNKHKNSEQTDIQFYCFQGHPKYLGSWL